MWNKLDKDTKQIVLIIALAITITILTLAFVIGPTIIEQNSYPITTVNF